MPGLMTLERRDGRASFRYDLARVRWPERPCGMWAWRDLLPLDDPAHIVTLGEGDTPLLPARLDLGCRLFWKLECANPTGSQKDRALSVALSKAVELGAPRVVIASTGGAGLAAAAYAARAGLPCVVLVPAETPAERLRPMQALGARLVRVQGSFVQIERLLERLAENPAWHDVTTKRAANPFQAEGPKTIAYEIAAQLGRVPERVVVPVGGGGTLAGIWKGFVELHAAGRADRLPRLTAVQSDRFNTLERALALGLASEAELAQVAMDEGVEVITRNLKHGLPPDGGDALAALIESGGSAVAVSDQDALHWQARIGAGEGIFCEPSSAVVGAAVARLVGTGAIGREECVVAVVTGSGMRETGILATPEPLELPGAAGPADLEALLAA